MLVVQVYATMIPVPVRKCRGKWSVDLSFHGERRRLASPLNTKGGAHEYELQLRQELAIKGSLKKLGVESVSTTRIPTLAAFSERWLREYVDLENRYAERVRKRSALRLEILPTFGHLRLDEITTRHLDDWKRALASRGLTAKSVNNYLGVARKCLGSAADWGLIAAVPRVRPLQTVPPPFRYLDEVTIRRLAAEVEGEPWRAMITIAAGTGLRFSELAGLAWTAVSFEHRTIEVCRSRVLGHLGTTKSGRIRHVPLTSDVLLAFHALQGHDREWVFVHRGRPITYDAAAWHLDQACRRSGIEPIGWHVLRHSFASSLASRGASLQAIQSLLGHATINMTLRYAHLNPSFLRDTVALLETAPAPHPAPIGRYTGSNSPEAVPIQSEW